MHNNNLYNKVKNEIFYLQKKHHFRNVLLCISGGVDSIVLFNIINIINKNIKIFNFSITYYNHQQRKKTSKDEALCQTLAKKNNLIFYKGSINKSYEKSISETVMRNKRYDYFYSLVKKYSFDALFTAHHMDDQIETYYMRKMQTNDNVILSGIRKENGILFRPLLVITKDEILSYAKKNRLQWNEDETNSNNNILRNKIRNKILPNLFLKNRYYKNQIINNIKENLYISNKILLNVDIFFKKKINQNNGNLYIPISDLINLNDLIIKYILKKCYRVILCEEFHFTSKHFDSFISFLNNKNNNIYFNLSKTVYVYKTQNLLILFKKNKSNNNKIQLTNDKLHCYGGLLEVHFENILESYEDSNSMTIDRHLYNKGLYIRNWNNGDKICYNSNGNRKKLKKILSELKILPFNKKNVPILVTNNDEILWIIGYRKSFTNYSNYKDSITLKWRLVK